MRPFHEWLFLCFSQKISKRGDEKLQYGNKIFLEPPHELPLDKVCHLCCYFFTVPLSLQKLQKRYTPLFLKLRPLHKSYFPVSIPTNTKINKRCNKKLKHGNSPFPKPPNNLSLDNIRIYSHLRYYLFTAPFLLQKNCKNVIAFSYPKF